MNDIKQENEVGDETKSLNDMQLDSTVKKSWSDSRFSTMNKYGAVLDDFGLDTMLDKIIVEFATPFYSIFFPNLCGSSLDSHHGFVI